MYNSCRFSCKSRAITKQERGIRVKFRIQTLSCKFHPDKNNPNKTGLATHQHGYQTILPTHQCLTIFDWEFEIAFFQFICLLSPNDLLFLLYLSPNYHPPLTFFLPHIIKNILLYYIYSLWWPTSSFSHHDAVNSQPPPWGNMPMPLKAASLPPATPHLNNSKYENPISQPSSCNHLSILKFKTY